LVTASLGLALYPEHGEYFDQLMKHADLAMFIAKDNGKNQFSIYHDTIGMETKNYVEVVSQIRHAIEKEEFILYYQPIINLSSGKIIAVEALIRWEHPTRGFLTPYHFIDIAEKSGQISKIGKWVFEKACGQLKIWQEKDVNLKMSINLSGKRLFDENLIEDIKKTLKANGLKKGSVQIEITETAVMKNIQLAIGLLHQIRELGIQIALDDFGTGYSSLTYLQIFPIDVLKIDKEFIGNISIAGMEKDNNIINAIINLAHSMDLEIVAEGIETYDQAEYLLINDCDFGQGYYYDRPMPVEDIENKYFAKHK
jgi:EAL domain-containing protein (putative c-di-GMP-specific phosphodiesterase class I)